MAGLLVIVALLLAACGPTREESAAEKPATVETIAGTNLKRVSLTAKSAERLGIETAVVRALKDSRRASARSVPYSALLYDPNGTTSVYTNPEPLIFVKQTITVDHITGDVVFLSTGPPVGTRVVTVGAAELFGIEFGIGAFE